MKRLLTMLLCAALLLAAVGCTSREPVAETPDVTETPATATPVPTPNPTETPAPTEEPVEETPAPTEEPEPAYRNAFNGEGMEEPDNTRPFAVMINNLKEAQPQCGVSDADIIYEVLAEGGVTRMMAIFSDITKATHLGSIRSIRPYYIDISLAYGAVTVHAGGSDDAYSRIRSSKIENIDGVRGSYKNTPFARDQQRIYDGYATEHTLFANGEKLYACAEQLGYALTVGEDYDNGLRFVKDATPADGTDCAGAKIVFNSGKTTGLTYHEDTGLFTATQHGGSYKDGNTGDAVTFRNVLAIWAPTKVLDSYGRLSVGLTGGGEGYYACGGKYVEITWERDTVQDCFRYYLSDGTELSVSEGKTYVAVLSIGESRIEFN